MKKERLKQTFSVPIKLEVGVSKKKTYYLNLNNYRNWQHHLNNQLKKTFKLLIAEKVRNLEPLLKPCRVTFEIYYPTRRLFDVDNIGAVVSKFTHDALVELEILTDDNYTVIPEIVYRFGGIDKDNARCDVTVEEI
jgi:Holliday junction resolvase RusA-like endonuclease